MEDTRICKICNTEKSIAEFYENRSRCKACRVELEKENPNYKEKRRDRDSRYYANHRQEIIKRQAERQKSGLVCCVTHGITPDEHDQLFIKQDGRCAICDIDQCELNYPLYIDHNHSTGKIRGLLCCHCNYMLGNARDNPEILRSAIDYLEKY
jgi:hypothetical protein